MKKLIPAFFIVLMTGLVGAKIALADHAQEAAGQPAISYDVRF